MKKEKKKKKKKKGKSQTFIMDKAQDIKSN
jgi:hypothetical protein